MSGNRDSPDSSTATSQRPSKLPGSLLQVGVDGKQERSEQPLSWSRACAICCTGNPRHRAVFSSCGHAVCRACALQIEADAMCANLQDTCPFCRKNGVFNKLEEELRSDYGAENSAECSRLLAAEDAEMAALGAAVRTQREARHAIEKARAEAAAADEAVEAARNALEAAESSNEINALGLAAVRDGLASLLAVSEQAQAHVTITVDQVRSCISDCQAAVARARTELINQERKESEDCENRGLIFSRLCRGCAREPSERRVFFPSCCHAVCADCAQKDGQKCPDCGIQGNSVPLYEDLIQKH